MYNTGYNEVSEYLIGNLFKNSYNITILLIFIYIVNIILCIHF